jgi:hypothetical protein
MQYMDLFLISERDIKWFEERGCEFRASSSANFLGVMQIYCTCRI